MTTTHQAHCPTVALDYFGSVAHVDHPIVGATFIAGRGWRTYPIRKRVSGAWVRQARQEGVTDIVLACDGRRADFRIAELAR